MPQYAAVIDLSTLDGTTGFRLDGIDAGDRISWSVASAGDVNGDGFADLVIGAPKVDPGGESYVVFGKASGWMASFDLSTLDGTTGFRLDGIDAYDRSGRSVASAGDVNGDGFDDVIIGAYGGDPGGDGNAGESYVVFGKASGFAAAIDLGALDGTNGFRLDGIDAGDRSGFSVASAGDVNGDGFDDLIIGAFGANPGGDSYAGESYVVFGKASGFAAAIDLATLDGTTGFRLDGIDALDLSGWSVASAGDVNGDGFDDLIIGANRGDPGGDSSAGETYVVFGKASGFSASLDLSTLDGTTGFRLDGIDDSDFSGWSVASAGDVNGDGFDDVIIGADRADPSGDIDAGESYVVFGKASGFAASLDLSTLDGTNGFRLDGIDASDQSGGSVASAGDFNGDGFDDLIIGAHNGNPGGDGNAGESYVVFGKASGFAAAIDLSTLDGTNGFRLDGIDAYDQSGFSVASAGDVNGDGFDDLIIGAAYGDPGGDFSAGESYVVFGGKPGEAVTRTGTAIANRINGGDLADTLSGLGGDDTLIGHGGFDQLDGGTGADTLIGGTSSDIYFVDDAGDEVVEAVDEGGGDYVVVSIATYTLTDNVEDLGHDGGGSLTATGNSLGNFMIGNFGFDSFSGLGGADNLELREGADFADGGADDDTLLGEAGNDTLKGGLGSDSLDGGADVDTVSYEGSSAAVNVSLETGAASGGDAAGDTIAAFEHAMGSSHDDTLTGSEAAANDLRGGVGNDALSGLSGADTLIGGSGADSLDGGADVDTATYSDAAGAVTVNLNSGTGTGDIAQGDVLTSIENVAGGDFNDVLTGAHGVDNLLDGGLGNDNINGFSGNDTIIGGDGNDTLTGNFSADSLDGGAGTDIAVYSDATARVVVRLWNGTGEGNLAQGDVLTGIENLYGSNFNDILFGADAVANWLHGGAGPDYLNGLSGNDTLVGGSGNDSLAGGSGADRHDFSAGSGVDRVFSFISGAAVWDVIRITGYGAALDTFAEILAVSTQVGADTVINLGGGNTITLVGVIKTSLVADDFLFA